MLDTHNRPENGMCDMRHLVDSFNLCLHARASVCVCVCVCARLGLSLCLSGLLHWSNELATTVCGYWQLGGPSYGQPLLQAPTCIGHSTERRCTGLQVPYCHG